MPGTWGRCCGYVCPPTPCPTYRRELAAWGECSLTNRRAEEGLLFGADTELTHARLFWQTQMVRTCSGVHATYFGAASGPAALLNPLPCRPSWPSFIANLLQSSFQTVVPVSDFYIYFFFFSPTLFYHSASASVQNAGAQVQIFPKALASVDGIEIGNSCRSKLMSNFVLKLKITKTDGW